jgi:hypothetical protein
MILKLFDEYIENGTPLPVMSKSDFDAFVAEVWASEEMNALEKDNAVHHYLYKGQALGVDLNQTENLDGR